MLEKILMFAILSLVWVLFAVGAGALLVGWLT